MAQQIDATMKYGWIYKITSNTGLCYIGKTTNIKKRFVKYENPNCHEKGSLYEKIKELGWSSFSAEILFEGQATPSLLDELEKHFIRLYNTFDSTHGLNTQSGGKGGFRISIKGRKNLSEAHKGHKQSLDTIEKRASKLRGLKRSDAVRKHLMEVSPLKKTIVDIETGVFYESIREAAEAVNIKRTTLNAMLLGQNTNRTNLKYA